MKIIKLDCKTFDNISRNHSLHSYYQTSNYGEFMRTKGFIPDYYGFMDDKNNLVGASLILTKKLFLGYKYSLVLNGFLINYNDGNIIKKTTELLKPFLQRNNVILLKIVLLSQIDNNNNIIENMKKCGYEYDNKPNSKKYNAILNINKTPEAIYKRFNKKLKVKIQTAKLFGVEAIKGNNKDINVFYKILSKEKKYNIDDYKSLYKCFGKNFNVYFATLDTKKYIEKVAQTREYQKNKSENINIELLTNKENNNYELVEQKIIQDKLLFTSEKALKRAIKLAKKYPKSIIIGACATITDNNEVSIIVEYQNNLYKSVSSQHFLKWAIIQESAKKDFSSFKIDSIEQREAEVLQQYGANIIEQQGDFNLVINKKIYRIFKKFMKSL